jgi:hypothetical protein
VAVPIDETGTASVAPVMVLLVPGVQKPPHRVGKRFWDHLKAAPEGKVEIPAGLKTRPAWLRQDHLGANPVVCRGNAGCQARWTHLLNAERRDAEMTEHRMTERRMNKAKRRDAE